jgi:magnesium transporter
MVGDELAVGEVDVFVGLNYVLSIRNRSSEGFLGVRARCEREPHLLSQGAGFVFYALMDAVVDRYFPVLDAFETELENIEEHIFVKGSARSNIERLYALKRKVMVLKHAVAPLMENAGKLYRGRVPMVCANSQEYFRDVFDHLNHINTSIDTIRDTIGTAIQVNLSMVTIEESEVTKRLAAWAGIFAVATAFAGIWGMNFDVMPELRLKYGYPAALTAITLVCCILYRRFKKAGWL